VVGLQEPQQAVAVPRTRFADLRVGDLCYEGYASAEPTGPDRLRWTMEYRTLEGATVLSDRIARYDWWIVSPPTLLAELAEAGLAAQPADAGLVVARSLD
jgi:hypothetical protein